MEKRFTEKGCTRKEQKEESGKRSGILNNHRADSGAKLIFEDNTLCCQFLNGYVPLPFFKDVKPEDIEDVSSEFTPMFSEERYADRVKKIKVHTRDEKTEKEFTFFLISLIEHKTHVDYNIHMQIFRYMVYIWERHARECEKQEPGCTGRKSFQYPPIVPIVYYEGKGRWTAPEQFKEKIVFGEQFEKYLPNFSYYIVPLHQYSNEVLLEHGDEISVVMLMNRMQTAQDVEELRRLPTEKLDAILEETPDYLLDIIAKVLRTFLLEENVPEEETDELVGIVKERRMGRLFENMDKMDIQAERKNTQREKERADKAEDRAAKEKDRADKAEQRGIEGLIASAKELGASKEYIINKLCSVYNLTPEDAEEMVNVKTL